MTGWDMQHANLGTCIRQHMSDGCYLMNRQLLWQRPDSTPASYLQAYKRAALKYHPDKASADDRGEAEKKFKQVNAANSILSDPAKRQRYDAGVCRFPPICHLRCQHVGNGTLAAMCVQSQIEEHEGVCRTLRVADFAGWTDEEIEQGAPEGAGGGAQMDDILASMFAQRQSAAFGGGGGFGGGGFPFGAQGGHF